MTDKEAVRDPVHRYVGLAKRGDRQRTEGSFDRLMRYATSSKRLWTPVQTGRQMLRANRGAMHNMRAFASEKSDAA